MGGMYSHLSFLRLPTIVNLFLFGCLIGFKRSGALMGEGVKFALHIPTVCYKAKAWVGLGESTHQEKMVAQPSGGRTGSAFLNEGGLGAESGLTQHDTCEPQGSEVSPTFSLGTASDLWACTRWGSRTRQRSTWILCSRTDESAIAFCW